eukprot:NODE_157_length_15108_cov_0.423079.p8 type:complete len:159 gc:universal NODE_157_length_15108_cov_0.423079:4989-4513(-)
MFDNQFHNIFTLILLVICLLSLNKITYNTPIWMKMMNVYTVKLTWYYVSIIHLIFGNAKIYLYYTAFYTFIYYATDLFMNLTSIDISGHVYITLLGYASMTHTKKAHVVANVFLFLWSIVLVWTLINFHFWEEKIIAACFSILFYCDLREWAYVNDIE